MVRAWVSPQGRVDAQAFLSRPQSWRAVDVRPATDGNARPRMSVKWVERLRAARVDGVAGWPCGQCSCPLCPPARVPAPTHSLCCCFEPAVPGPVSQGRCHGVQGIKMVLATGPGSCFFRVSPLGSGLEAVTQPCLPWPSRTPRPSPAGARALQRGQCCISNPAAAAAWALLPHCLVLGDGGQCPLQ